MADGAEPRNIMQSFRSLRGNTRACIVTQPLWGIPYTLYTFYLSLYMKSQGVSDHQIGFLISLGFVSGFAASIFTGMVIDALGRKRALLIFDLLAWPAMVALYAAADRFWHFALAASLGNAALRIASVAWNLTLVEDALPEERVAAFNLFNLINVTIGILTPAAGLLIRRFGIVAGERALLGFAAVSMTAMMLIRNRCLQETTVGREILDERRRYGGKITGNPVLFYSRTLDCLRARPRTRLIILAVVLFNTFAAFGSFNSLYYTLYLTEALRLDKTAIAFLGGVNSCALFAVLAFLVPALKSAHRRGAVFWGLGLQAAALVMYVLIPRASLYWAMAATLVFAFGFGLFRPFLDSLLAGATEGKERAGLYSVMHLCLTSLCALMGVVSGYLYHLRPALLYLVCLGMLGACGILLRFGLGSRRERAGAVSSPEAGGSALPRIDTDVHGL